MATTRSDVWEALSGMDTSGDTSAGGASVLPALPGLEVDGVGPVALPLNDVQAKALAAVAVQAPHGKGLKTVVDTSVRNTLQFDAAKVHLRNPMWAGALDEQVAAAAEALGVNKRCVTAELYKLLLYETGGFFKRHKDTEKADGMFGTLVVQLPSKFTGGTFEVSHAGKARSFTMGAGADAAYGCQFVAHYSDCDHEIKPVESGYRLALVYSLCYTGDGDTPSAQAVGGVSELSAALKGLPKDESLVVLGLEHEYTTASLGRYGVGCLKGADRAKYQALHAASEGAYTFLMAVAARTDIESGDGHEYYGGFDVCDTEKGDPELEHVFNEDGSDGSDAIKKLSIDWSSCVDGGALLGDEDEEEAVWGEGDEGHVEYTGNEGASRETTYNCCVLLAYPKAAELELLLVADMAAVVRDVATGDDVAKLSRVMAHLQKRPTEACSRLTLDDHTKLVRALSTMHADPTKPSVVEMIRFVLCDIPPRSGGANLTDGLVNEVVEVVHRCGWTAVGSTVIALMAGLRQSPNATSSIARRADLAIKLLPHGGETTLVYQAACDLLCALEKPVAQPAPYHYHPRRTADRSDVLTKRTLEALFKAGTAAELQRFVAWAERAPEPELKVAVDMLPAAGDAGGVASDVRRCIVERQREAKLEVLRRRQAELEASTRGGEPVFTWAMQGEKAGGVPQIITYLRSTQSNRVSIVVGGGIANARSICAQLEGNGRSSYYHRHLASQQSIEAAMLQRGFSVTAISSGTGGNATVTITKTKAYHEARVADFRRKSAELAAVRKEIQQLGDDRRSAAASGSRLQPTSGASVNGEPSSAAGTDNGPVAKKPRRSDPPPAEGGGVAELRQRIERMVAIGQTRGKSEIISQAVAWGFSERDAENAIRALVGAGQFEESRQGRRLKRVA